MKKYLLFLFISAYVLISGANASSENEKEELVNKIIDVYGGEKRLGEIKGTLEKGKAFVRLENVECNLTRRYSYPDKLKIEKSFAAIDSKTRITDGKKVWLNETELFGSFEELMFLKAKTLFLAKYIAEHRDDIEYQGEVTSEDGRSWHILNIKFPSQSEMMLQIDPQTHYVMSAITTVHQFPDKKTLLTLYENHKIFDGVLVAMTEHSYMNGYYFERTNIEKVEFVDAIDEAVFVPEKKPEPKKKP